MSHDDEHADLKRLFDETAEQPSGATLTKLAARAVDAPARAPRVPRFLPSWAFRPAFAGVALAVAAGVALALALPENAPSELPALSASGALSAATPSHAPSAPLVSSPPPALASALPSAEAAEGELDLGLDSADSDGPSFNVSGPDSDQDLDAWLAASKVLAEGS